MYFIAAKCIDSKLTLIGQMVDWLQNSQLTLGNQWYSDDCFMLVTIPILGNQWYGDDCFMAGYYTYTR